MSTVNSIEEFLDSIEDEKLVAFPEKEGTMLSDYQLGYHLDFQGYNSKAGEPPLRLYIQPLRAGGTSKS